MCFEKQYLNLAIKTKILNNQKNVKKILYYQSLSIFLKLLKLIYIFNITKTEIISKYNNKTILVLKKPKNLLLINIIKDIYYQY